MLQLIFLRDLKNNITFLIFINTEEKFHRTPNVSPSKYPLGYARGDALVHGYT